MIVEWIYTNDIQRLKQQSPTLLLDLPSVFVAADMFLLTDLCDAIKIYLKHLLDHDTFGDIFRVAKAIECRSMEKDILQAWIAKSDAFNESDAQIQTLLREFGDFVVEKDGEVAMGDQYVLQDSDATVALLKRMIDVSGWEGESASNLDVITCLAALLSVGTGTKKRKLD